MINSNNYQPNYFLSPWNHLTKVKYTKNTLTYKDEISQRIQSVIFGTFYDLAMIPTNASLAIIKIPLALLRPIVKLINSTIIENYFQNCDIKNVAKHLYRTVGLITIVVANPFISLISPNAALYIHLRGRLISRWYENHLQISLKKQENGFENRLAEIKQNAKDANSIDEIGKCLNDLDNLNSDIKDFDSKHFYFSHLFCQKFDEKLKDAKIETEQQKQKKLDEIRQEEERIKREKQEREEKIRKDYLKLLKDVQDIGEIALKIHDFDEIINEYTKIQGLKRFFASEQSQEVEATLRAQLLNETNQMLSNIEKHLESLNNEHSELFKVLSSNGIDIKEYLFKKEVQILFREIQRLRKEKSNPNLKNNADHILARKIAKARFALSVGIELESTGKGIHGAMFVKSINRKKLGVFKPQEDNRNSPLLNQIGSLLKQKLGQGQEEFLNQGRYAETCTEKAAYLVAKGLDCQDLTVSPVKIINLQNKIGAFLVFAKNTKEAKDIASELDAKLEYTDAELDIFQIFTIFDYLIGNLDRHSSNWLVNWENENLKKIVPIDNANCFPKQVPNFYNFGAWMNLFAWKNFNIANQSFTDKIKEYVKTHLTQKRIEIIISSIDQDEEIKNLYKIQKIKAFFEKYITQEMIDNIKKRLASKNPKALKELNNIGNISEFIHNCVQLDSLEKIMKILTDADMELGLLYKNQKEESLLSKESKEGIRKRASILRSIAISDEEKQIQTPYQLATIGL